MSKTGETLPKLRMDLQIVPVDVRGERIFVIQDVLGIVKTPVGIPRQMISILGLLDGNHTREQMEHALKQSQGGVLSGENQVDDILDQLDEAFILETDRYREALAARVKEFSTGAARPSVLAGHAYPDDPEKLAAYVDSILSIETTTPNGPVRALAAPHLDIKEAEPAYAAAYRAIRDAEPKRVIILGTGHTIASGLFSLTDRDFETPLGRVKTDKALVAELAEAGEGMLTDHPLAHVREHSIELQLIFLQRVLKKDFQIVPVLCGSPDPFLSENTRLSDVIDTVPFLSVLQKYAEMPDTLVIAGVDLAHIGPKFGHDQTASELENDTKEHDKILLDALSGLDAAKYWQALSQDNNQYNICGALALACLLEIYPTGKGQVLAYHMWHEEATRSAVSYAAVAFG